ncbi:putative tail fiber domain protein [Clostridioides difficile CD211]|nr:putative tail fiber domain protein [Clostridioides difficile CD211]EQF81881.1 putative tail fiber domain protein [Clostridioides difficile CD211]
MNILQLRVRQLSKSGMGRQYGNTTTDETAPNCIILESLIPSSVGGL